MMNLSFYPSCLKTIILFIRSDLVG